MNLRSSRVVWGAILFAPGMRSGGVHIPILLMIITVMIAVGVLFAMLRRSWRPEPPGPDPGDGWGRGPKDPDPEPPLGPRGGIPLADALPARVRLRGPGRLADMLPARPRRRVVEPDRRPTPQQVPHR